MKRALERTLVAWAVGSLVGILAFIGEWLLGTALLTAGGLAAYALAGGAVAAASRSVLAPIVPAAAARDGAVCAIAAFGSLHALHYVNVRLLPGQHFLETTSLLVDLVIAIPLLVAALWLSRAGWVQDARERFGRLATVAGAVTLAGASTLALAALPRRTPEPERNGAGPSLLLVVLDSVRADRLPAEGTNPATPELGRLAMQARRYASAWAASSWTLPSVDVLLSDGPSSSSRARLPERLAAQGYRTACFTDNPHLAAGEPVVRGFDHVERSLGPWRSLLFGTALGEVVDRLLPGHDSALVDGAIAWMRKRDRPFFLYVQLMDSHTPYRFPPLDRQKRGGRRVEFPFSRMELSQEEMESIRARYDGGVLSAEAQAARLVAAVAAQGRPFVAVITSDHGESLGEDGRWFHGGGLQNELLLIPLLVLGEGVEPGVVHEPVGHAAIAQTLLGAAGVGCADDCGIDLRQDSGPGIAEGGLPPRLAYRIANGFKLIVDVESGQRTLFDLRADPHERHDIANSARDAADELAAGLMGRSRLDPRSREIQERLRALGYVGS